jgi:hypothetical protein
VFLAYFILLIASLAYAIGPSVNTSRALNWFFLPNPIFAICLNFHQQNPLEKQYLPHLTSENWEINSITSDSQKAFQQHKECPQISIQFSGLILFNFHWKNGSIINGFHTPSPKQPQTKSGHPYSWIAFRKYQGHNMKHWGLLLIQYQQLILYEKLGEIIFNLF